MPQGRPPYGFALIDLPSDHEIDGGLVTESQMIHAVLHNRKLGSRTKLFRATSKSGLEGLRTPYQSLGFVHLATHGSTNGISLIGATLSWSDVANKIQGIAPKLSDERKRILTLSCCFSRSGYKAMRKNLNGYFTGAYYFEAETVTFATAMTVWGMFYRKKTLSKPAEKIADAINDFFGEKTICYGKI